MFYFYTLLNIDADLCFLILTEGKQCCIMTKIFNHSTSRAQLGFDKFLNKGWGLKRARLKKVGFEFIDFSIGRMLSWSAADQVVTRTDKLIQYVFCSTSLPITSTRWFNQCIQAFAYSKKCRWLISATSRNYLGKIIQKNSWECRESNWGLLGEKCKCYLCAMPPTDRQCLASKA